MNSNSFQFTALAYNVYMYRWCKDGFTFYRVLAVSNDFLGVCFLRLQEIKKAEKALKNGKIEVFPTTEPAEDGYKDERFSYDSHGTRIKKYRSWIPAEFRLKFYKEKTILTKEKERKIFEKLDNLYSF